MADKHVPGTTTYREEDSDGEEASQVTLLPHQAVSSGAFTLPGSRLCGVWKGVALFLLTASLCYLFISESINGAATDLYRRTQRQWSPASPSQKPPNLPPDTKIILFWTKFFTAWDIPYLHDKMAACPNYKCFLTNDRRYLQASSAVIFHIRNLDASDLPASRSAKQLYVFFLLESPPHTDKDLKHSPWPGFFNLTWTYRRDSDVFNIFYMERFRTMLWNNVTSASESLRKKQDRAIVFSSHCPTSSRREDYIAQLQRHFPVDIVGSCGPGLVDCPKEDPDCEKRLVATYKFYLAFENSYCKDYVTEKVMRAVNFVSLPIVYGAVDYSHFMPPKSFIDVAHFASPKDLAVYLWNLTQSPLEYAKYFQWKFNANYTRIVDPIAQPEVASTCGLCRLLHDKNFKGKRYHDMHDWWVEKGNCSVPAWTNCQRKPRSKYQILDFLV